MDASSSGSGAFSASRLRGITAAISAITAVGIGLSLSLPLLALTLEARGISGTWIGLNTAVAGISALLVTPLAPALAFRIGTARATYYSVALAALALIGFYYATAFWMWFPLRFLFHGAVTVAFILSEYWINALAPDSRRGLVMGIYATVLSIGFAAGPLLFTLTGTQGLVPFVSGAALLVAAAVPVLLARNDEPPSHGEGGSLPLLTYLVGAPLGTLAGLVFGAVESGSLSLLPVFGVRIGLAPSEAALLVSAVALGNVVLQIPLGLAADRFDRRWLLFLCAAIGAAGALLMPTVSGNLWLLIAVLFIWGGFIAGLYTIGLTHLGARYRGKALAGANAAFVMMYSAGMLLGPSTMGAGLTLFGAQGLPFVAAAFFGVFALFALLRISSRRARKAA
ncbi:MFS transporter [Stappia sp. F7233]|uniref:MFS transporter n=1 Tax=Stappia albiluteola TaxID=2758565 RepID=A0A839AFY6_9HYPH|nr:MFS transporter [Stappia albiluteola]MBA5778006.1 MFS transporter [Stappia albiluteola]